MFKHYQFSIKRTVYYLQQPDFLKFFIAPVVLSLLVFLAKSFFESIFSFFELANSSFWKNFTFQIHYLLALTILSPLYGVLSRKIIENETGRKVADGWLELVNDLMRMLLISVIILIFQLIIIYPLYLLFWIFGMGFLLETVSFLVDAVLLGFAFFDYGLEIQRMDVSRSLVFIRRNLIHCLLIGTLFLFMIKIPLVGLMLSPVLLTMLATIVYLRIQNK
jgi:uncharacterized protein involved in cysteine biosynthesis